MGFENIFIDHNAQSNDFAACYRNARENSSDYFVIFSCAENDRAVSITADIYTASTGSLVEKVHLIRTGNQMLPEAGRAAAEALHELLPVYGRIVNRKFDEILVNLGEKDGISEGDELIIIKKGGVVKSKNDFGLDYDKSAVIGTYLVEHSDELVSDGSITPDRFFDMINPGDLVLIPPAEVDDNQAAVSEDEQLFYTGNLFDTITNIP